MEKVVSYLKIDANPKYILKVPLNQRVGKVYWTVQSPIEPVTFLHKRDAIEFQNLLLRSVNVEAMNSDIVRREITDEGYHLH